MDAVNAALRDANDTMRGLVDGRLETLHAMEREVTELPILKRAVEALGRERSLRDELERALSLPATPDHRAAVDDLLGRLRSLGAQADGALTRGAAKLGVPCIPCLQRALLAEAKKLQQLPGRVEAELRATVSRVEKKLVKTAREALQQINERLGTAIDFDALSHFDGAQWLRGKVLPAVNKGVLLATGIDLGKLSARDLRDKLKLPEELAARLDGYVGLLREKAAAQLKKLPLEVTRAAANLLDQAARSHAVQELIKRWDTNLPRGLALFRELTSGQQTVLFSQAWREAAGAVKDAATDAYLRAARSGEWRTVEAALRSFPTADRKLRERLAAEATLLRDGLRRLEPAPR